MPRMVWCTPSPFSRQSRKIFQVFMRANQCSTPTRTCLWVLWAFFEPGSYSPGLRRCGITSPVPG